MKIIQQKTKYHKYSFIFEFSMEVLEFCRVLKEKYGWQEFSYADKGWHFTKREVLDEIKNKYPNVEIDSIVLSTMEKEMIELLQKEVMANRAEEIKLKENSDLEVKGLKMDLYPYQKVGVEFFINNNGRAILGDEMGCFAGKTEIIINRKDGEKKYKIRDLYLSFDVFYNNHYNWESSIYTKSYDEEKKDFCLNKIKNVLYKGKKNTLLLKARSDEKEYEIELTPDHEVLTSNGWKETKDISVGETIIANTKKTVVVTSIENKGEQDVYDIVMSDPHRNFIANGIVVHNCGKSAQSLAYVVHQNIKRSLIICPASVKYSWESETLKWTHLKPFVINSNTKFGLKEFNENNVFIINYDILKKFFDTLMSLNFESVVVDEVHYIKSQKAIRSKAVKMLAHKIPSALLLSGTPILNRPVELFNSLNIMDNKTWSNWYKYTERYCGGIMGDHGWEYKGATNIDELKKKISRYFLRRKKEDVLKELPPKRYINIPVLLSEEKSKEYEMAENNFERYLSAVKGLNDDDVQKSLQAQKLVQLNTLRQITSSGKVESAKEIIQSILDSEEKVIVFSVYNEPLEILTEHFKDVSVMITGKTKVEDRGVLVKKFQEDNNIKIFFGGLKSAGAGITLTAAQNVLFLDYSWVPADHSQGEDRLHRPGQTATSVAIYQLYSKNTIDEQMKEILESKKHIFNRLIEKDDNIVNKESESIINILLSNMNKRYEKK